MNCDELDSMVMAVQSMFSFRDSMLMPWYVSLEDVYAFMLKFYTLPSHHQSTMAAEWLSICGMQ